MKKATFMVLVLMMGLFVPSFVQATVYVSNLGAIPTGSKAVGSDSWLAESFVTGANPDGYALNSVQLLMNAASGTPSGFAVSIYDLNNSPFSPGNSLGTLTGPDPAAGGNLDYIATNITLLPSTFYFVVATSTTPIASGDYNWSLSNAGGASDGWSMGTYTSSSDGSTWIEHRGNFLQFALDATPVPEPSTCALAAIGLAVLGFSRRKR